MVNFNGIKPRAPSAFGERPYSAVGAKSVTMRPPAPVPAGAKWITAPQVRVRYGGRSDMWLHRKLKADPSFPRPVYDGPTRLFSVEELDAYDKALILARIDEPAIA